MSIYNFYYDSMIKSPDLTFRILGIESSSSTPQTYQSAKVIVRDFIRDPLTFAVTHSYSQNSGGVVNALNNFKAFLAKAELSVEKIVEQYNDLMKQFGAQEGGSLDAAAYRQSITWIDFFKTFNYSQVNIPLNFNVRLYPKSDSSGNISSVKDQVLEINKYFLSKGRPTGDNTTYTYDPPHGYQPSQSAAAKRTIEGSLTLLYGRYAVIDSLILTNYQVTFSKELIRTSPEAGNLSPAYADLAITLEPATVLTQTDIATILASDYYANEYRKEDERGWLTNGDYNSYKEFYDNPKYV